MFGLDFDLHVPTEWQRIPGDDVHRWRHESGLELVLRSQIGERGRFEVAVLPAATIATAPAPRLRVVSEYALVPWLGGASAEIVALTGDGPIFAQQRRGFAVGSLDDASLLPEPLVVVPGHPLSSVWVVERLGGDLLDLPPEPKWLPDRRHVPYGDEVVLHLPDGIVTGVPHQESGDDFLLFGAPGLHIAEVGGPTGITRLEVGWHRDWDELVATAAKGAPEDLAAYLGVLRRDVDLDLLEARLARVLETPTLWGVLAAGHGVGLGVCTADEARIAAEAVLPEADVATRVALVSRGLADVTCLVGVQLGREAYQGLLRFGLGRVMSEYPVGAERLLIPGWFWIAGMAETPLSARIGGMLAKAHARALCQASWTLDPEAVAWLSLAN